MSGARSTSDCIARTQSSSGPAIWWKRPPFAHRLRSTTCSTKSGRSFRTAPTRSEEHTSELQSLMRISYAVFCLKINTEPTKDKLEDHTQHANLGKIKSKYTTTQPTSNMY